MNTRATIEGYLLMTMTRSDKESSDAVHNSAISDLDLVCLEKGFVIAISSDYLAAIRTSPKLLDRCRLCGKELKAPLLRGGNAWT